MHYQEIRLLLIRKVTIHDNHAEEFFFVVVVVTKFTSEITSSCNDFSKF